MKVIDSRRPPSNRITVFTRTAQCLAAAAVMTGVAFSSMATGSAEEPFEPAWEVQAYLSCLGPEPHSASKVENCCIGSMGDVVKDAKGNVVKCQSPPARQVRNPTDKPAGAPSQVEAEQGPGAPIAPVPIWPNKRRG